MRMNEGNHVKRVDPQRRSVWLRHGQRLSFAEARRLGIDVENVLAAGGNR